MLPVHILEGILEVVFTVSVMDTTFDTDHPDLVDVFVTGYNALDQTTNVHCEDNTSMNGGSNSGCTSLGVLMDRT